MSSAIPPLNPQVSTMPVYVPGRPIEEVAREQGLDAREIIKLASNENPLGPSPKAVAAMQRVLGQLHLYPDGNSFYLKRALAHQLGLETNQLTLGNGSNEILELVSHAFLNPDTEVVVSQYCFAVYPIVAALAGAKLVTVPAVRYGHDIPAMLSAITKKTRVIFVANPNNPTGTLISREDISCLLTQTPPEVLIVLDEAYIEFLDDPVDCLPLIRNGVQRNLLLSRTFSKIYGLAGLRLGYGMAHPEIVAALEKVRQPFNINAVVQAGALAALEDQAHLSQTRKNNAAGVRFLEREIEAMGLPLIPSSANFVVVRAGDGARVFSELQKRGVITRPMAGYQMPEWLRVSVGTPTENERFLSALREVLK